MKCLILAAGYATRLYPLTENFPKPLLLSEKSSGLTTYVINEKDNLNSIKIPNNNSILLANWAISPWLNIDVLEIAINKSYKVAMKLNNVESIAIKNLTIILANHIDYHHFQLIFHTLNYSSMIIPK